MTETPDQQNQGLLAALKFYHENYDDIAGWVLTADGKNVMLGNKENRVCRFCGGKPPAAKFRRVAHAIPEQLGNKHLRSYYECDACNEFFGKGIETDLGNWSMPMRTMLRICGSNGVPTMKQRGPTAGWRIEYGKSGFKISSYEANPIHEFDHAAKKLTLKLKRDPYTPVAVLKALMKIGITLMPEDEITNFPDLVSWVREPDHTKRFANVSVIETFQPGPMRPDVVAAIILRRKPSVTGLPYAFLVLAYANETLQVPLPSVENDAAIHDKPTKFYRYPTPRDLENDGYGLPRSNQLWLTGSSVVKNETFSLSFGFDAVKMTVPNQPSIEVST